MTSPTSDTTSAIQTEAWVSRLVAKSMSINERAENADAYNLTPEPWEKDRAEKAYADWRGAVDGKGPSVFEQRLQKSGWSLETAFGFLSTPKPVSKTDWPFWAQALHDFLVAAPPGSGRWKCDIHPNDRDLPFVEIIEPLAQWTCEKLSPIYDTLRPYLTASALKDLDRRLRQELSALCTSTLLTEFQAQRFRLSNGQPSLPGSTKAYAGFIDELHLSGLRDLFEKYPVLARFISTHLIHWQSFLREFSGRLTQDRQELEAVFSWRSDELASAVKLGLSDKHNNARVCIELVLGTGPSIFYKPKSLAPDIIFQTALADVSRWADLAPVSMPKTIDHQTYGWVEGARFAPCQTVEEVAQFYQKAGMVLFTQYLLGGSDLHHENLIAAGSDPVVVDHECLMSHLPLVRNETMGSAGQSDADLFLNSVMRVHMLPVWLIANAQTVSDTSSLGASLVTAPDQSTVGVRFPNTDIMRFDRQTARMEVPRSAPRLKDSPVRPMEYLQDLIAGFQAAYRAYVAHGASGEQVLYALSDTRFRYIFRNTQSYADLMTRICLPANLKSGVDAQIAIEGLWRAPLNEEKTSSDLSRLVDAEIAEIFNLDTPIFFSKANSRAVFSGQSAKAEQQVENYFAVPSGAVLRSRINQLGCDDEAEQCSHIRSSFHTRFPPHASPLSTLDSLPQDRHPHHAMEVGKNIADLLLDCAIRHKDGTLTWNGISTTPSGAWQSGSLPLCLYDGQAGIAVFLAATARVTGETRYEQAALAALERIIRPEYFALNRGKLTAIGLGIGKGLGSVIYGILTVATILKRPDLVRHAGKFARVIEAAELRKLPDVDVLGGSAGCLLAYAALDSAQPDIAWRTTIRRCADHLISRAHVEDGKAFWTDPNQSAEAAPRTGLAHGAGGIGYALWVAGEPLGDLKYKKFGRMALSYDDAVLIQLIDTSGEQSDPGCAWCNGIPSILAAKLAAMQRGVAFDAEAIATMSRALDVMISCGSSKLDHLCCGTAGPLSILNSYARCSLSFPSHSPSNDPYQQSLEQLFARSSTGMNFDLGWGRYTALPTFHQGLAGIGYTLLDHSTPGTLPQVALFQ